MSGPHIIRLRGPWWYRLADSAEAGEVTESNRIELPCPPKEILSLLRGGPVNLRRNFNRPTGLEDVKRVELSVDVAPFMGLVSLNGQTLGTTGTAGRAGTFDVRALILGTNRLDIAVEGVQSSDSLQPLESCQPQCGIIQLEIHE